MNAIQALGCTGIVTVAFGLFVALVADGEYSNRGRIETIGLVIVGLGMVAVFAGLYWGIWSEVVT